MARAELHPGRLALLIGITVAGVLLWDSSVLLPFKLLAVMGHETGHAVASLLLGGSVQHVTIRPGESGECLSLVPDGFFGRVMVSSAGYVGGCLIAVVLLLATFRWRLKRLVLASACLWLGLMTVFYARDLFTIAFALGMAVAFGLGAKWLPDTAVIGLNLFIASFQALYAAMDLRSDLWDSTVRAQSDAAILASTTGIPAFLWAVVWTAASAVILLAGAWLSLRAPAEAPVVTPRTVPG